MKKFFPGLRLLISVCGILVLPGCVNNAQNPHVIKGTYIWGPEVREFSACDGSPVIWAVSAMRYSGRSFHPYLPAPVSVPQVREELIVSDWG